MNPKFKIAEVAIELKEDGTPLFWVYNYGMHPGQGGTEFAYGNAGTESLETSLDILKINLLRDVDSLLELVKNRVKQLEKITKEEEES
jgi:hypothetical protein